MTPDTKPDDNGDFGWIMNGWAARLLAWDRAKQFAASIDRVLFPEAGYVADWKVTEASAVIASYKDEMVRGLGLVMRWLASCPFQDDFVSVAFERYAHNAMEPVVSTLRGRLCSLEGEVEQLRDLVGKLLQREDERVGIVQQGTEGGSEGEGSPPRDAGGRRLRAANVR